MVLTHSLTHPLTHSPTCIITDSLTCLLSFEILRYPKSVVMLAASLIEMSESEDECINALNKISHYIRYKPPRGATAIPATLIDDAETQMDYNRNPKSNIDPEEIPALLYQVIAVTRKCGGTHSPTRQSLF